MDSTGSQTALPSQITPDFVRSLTAPTDQFLCRLKDNVYGIRFGAFRIRELTTGFLLVDVKEDDLSDNLTEVVDDPKTRLVKYHFGPDFLKLVTIGLTFEFSIGAVPVPNLLMIERHYFKGKVIKSYEFKFGFCMPNSTNSLEVIYDLPELSDEEKEDMIRSPWETKSDTFFFVNEQLIVHNRAEYNYAPLDEEARDDLEADTDLTV